MADEPESPTRSHAAGQTTGKPTSAFVGRQHELTGVVDALGEPPALVLIEGEPGIGKTRLLHEALTAAEDRTVILAVCPPLREPFPFGPVVHGLQPMREHVAAAELSPLGGALRPLLPEWADILPPALEALDDSKETRHRLFRALTELIDRLGVDIVAVEDAHWADDATLEWLLTLCTSGDQRGSIVATYRPHEVPEGSPLRHLTSRLPPQWSQVRVELVPLGVDETRQLVGSMVGADQVSEKFASFLHEHTDGLPLAVEESVRLFRDRHDIFQRDGQWTRRVLDELTVPPTVRDSVLERLTRLDPAARRVLEAAGVVAAPADEELLAAVAGLDELTSRDGVAAALASGLLREAEAGRFAFRHALDSQAINEAIPASELRRMHGRAADRLEQVNPKAVVRLTRHHREAGNTEAWCRYAEASADLALESGDDRTAVLLLLDVLTGAEHAAEQQANLALKLGDAAGFGAAALGQDLDWRIIDVLRDTVERDDVPHGDRGEIRLRLGERLRQLSQEQAARTEIEAAIPNLDHCPDKAMLAMTILAYPLVPEPPGAWHLQWLDRAAELLPRLEGPGDRLSLAMGRATALLLLGEESGWRVAAKAPRPGPSPREQRIMVKGSLNLAQAATVWGHYADARQRLEATVGLMQTTGFQERTTTTNVAGAFLDWYMGDWKSARRTTNEIADARDAAPLDRLQARLILGMIDLASGVRTAEQGLRAVADHYTQLGSVEPAAVIATAALGRLHLSDDATDAALRITEPVMTMIARKGVWHWATDIAPVHADALVRAGRVDDVDMLVNHFTSWVEHRDAPAPEAALATCRAISAEAHGDHNLAGTLFADAAAAWAALPRPYDELLALERQGRCLLTTGEKGTSLAVLSDVEQRLTDLSARWDADRVAHLLRQHGVEVARTWRRGRHGYGDQLSPREREVVALVAQGMTNRQIAEALFLSFRTVERHIRNAMRKCDVSSRTALAMTATEAGLIAGTDESITPAPAPAPDKT